VPSPVAGAGDSLVTLSTPGAPLTYPASRLLQDSAGATRTYQVSGVTIDPGEGLRLADPIEGRVELARTNRGLFVRARFTTSLEAECSRCLREIEVPLELEVEEEALPSIDITTGQPVDIGAEPDVLRLNDHHEVELEQTVREAIQLAEPIAPLCEEACRGLCIECGERLEGDHDHGEAPVDPRLAGLLAFREAGDAERKPD
jgi:uncharacterized protein